MTCVGGGEIMDKCHETTDDAVVQTHPDTELAMEGTKATLLVKKLRGNIRHEHVWVMNGEGVAL